jgi:hypothetical protein
MSGPFVGFGERMQWSQCLDSAWPRDTDPVEELESLRIAIEEETAPAHERATQHS